MGVEEKLLPVSVRVIKNLKLGDFYFEINDGILTDDEKKLFTDDSDIVILKDCSGHEVPYSKVGTKRSEIIKKLPKSIIIYSTYKKSREERKR